MRSFGIFPICYPCFFAMFCKDLMMLSLFSSIIASIATMALSAFSGVKAPASNKLVISALWDSVLKAFLRWELILMSKIALR